MKDDYDDATLCWSKWTFGWQQLALPWTRCWSTLLIAVMQSFGTVKQGMASDGVGRKWMHQVVLRCAGQYLNSKDSIDSGASDTACWNLTRTAWVHIIGCYISIHMYIYTYICVCVHMMYIYRIIVLDVGLCSKKWESRLLLGTGFRQLNHIKY